MRSRFVLFARCRHWQIVDDDGDIPVHPGELRQCSMCSTLQSADVDREVAHVRPVSSS